MKPEESAGCHQTLSSWVESGDETRIMRRLSVYKLVRKSTLPEVNVRSTTTASDPWLFWYLVVDLTPGIVSGKVASTCSKRYYLLSVSSLTDWWGPRLSLSLNNEGRKTCYHGDEYLIPHVCGRVLPRPFPKGTVPFGAPNVPFGSAQKPIMCPLVPPQNQHIFNSHLNYLNLKTVWALNIELSEHWTELKCFVDSGTHGTNVWY